jgi:hypothetical protein
MQSAEPLSQLEQKMDAYEFFHQIVEPNCENALRPPYHLRLAWNAIVSLNTVPEFIVLHRLGYKTFALSRDRRDTKKNIRLLHSLITNHQIETCAPPAAKRK